MHLRAPGIIITWELCACETDANSLPWSYAFIFCETHERTNPFPLRRHLCDSRSVDLARLPDPLTISRVRAATAHWVGPHDRVLRCFID